MRTIAILNQKGGVGKTTTAVNLADALARAGKRVLLIDMDPQAHASMHVGAEAQQRGSYEVLTGAISAREALREVANGLRVIPTSIDLVAAELELADQPERELILWRALAEIGSDFDLAIIDCAPSLGLLSINALAAANEVLIPLQPHFLALQGLGKLLETVSLVRGVVKPDLRVSGVVLCMHERGTRLGQEVASDVQQFIRQAEFRDAWYGARVLTTCIRRNIKLAEAPSFGKSIFDYAPTSHGAEDYAALAGEVLGLTPPPAHTDFAAAPPAVSVAESSGLEGNWPGPASPLPTEPTTAATA